MLSTAQAMLSVLYTGAVRLTINSDTLRPSWFKNVEQGETDDVALQQAVDSCGNACILMLHGPVFLTKVCPAFLGPFVADHWQPQEVLASSCCMSLSF